MDNEKEKTGPEIDKVLKGQYNRAASNVRGQKLGSFTKDAEEYQQALSLAKEAALGREAGYPGAMTGGGGTDVGRVPLMYVDPLFDPILLMFPKENIKELNRRLRHYYSYHPYVRNLIDLHSTIPLSDFELKCEDKAIEREWNDFKEEINLLEIMTQMNRDYWLLGEAFLYGNWDEVNARWKSFNQYPPENVDIHRLYAGPGVAYFLKPDEELRKMLNSPKEVDRAIGNLLPTEFRDTIGAGKPYLLDNARVIHFARRPAGYSLRGESICKSILKDLLYEDKLRLLQYTFVDRHMFPIKLWKIGSAEKGWIPSKRHFDKFQELLGQACFSEDTEILTETGFKKYTEIDPTEKIATMNPATNKLEYRVPTKWNIYDYSGEMVHFKTPYADSLVTPNHRMWVRPYNKSGADKHDLPWRFEYAENVGTGYQFRAVIEGFEGQIEDTSVEIGDHKIDLKDLLKLVGFYISEGSYSKHNKAVTVYQSPKTVDFNEAIDSLTAVLPFKTKTSKFTQKEIHLNGRVYSNCESITRIWKDKAIVDFLSTYCGKKSFEKKIPTWIKQLPAEYLQVLLEAMMLGDGSEEKDASWRNLRRCHYYTTSKQLADDVQEICFKLGYRALMREMPVGKVSAIQKRPEYLINFFNGEDRKIKKGFFPALTKKSQISKVRYDGKVFCPTVPPHHLVVVKRDGKVMINGQSNDPDFNIIYHPFVQNEMITAVGKTEDLVKQFEFVAKRIMAGLFATEAMVGGEANPYANQAVSMKVVMHRYMMNRTQLETVIRNKIFLPMAMRRGYIRKNADHDSRSAGHSKYDLPRFFWQKLNLMNNNTEMEMLLRLRKDLEIPFELIADTFGWDPEVLKKAWAREQSTVLDPAWRKAREEVSKDPRVRNQILDGVKTEELIIPTPDAAAPPPKAKKGPGRPPLPEGDLSLPTPALIPNTEVGPREKQQEAGTLPTPMGE